MPQGEEMFKYHGYSGNCPMPPLPRDNGVDGVKRLIKAATGVVPGRGCSVRLHCRFLRRDVVAEGQGTERVLASGVLWPNGASKRPASGGSA